MIRTRFSPSPTGMIHLGNARAALFSALFGKKMQGHFVLRIEDTDIIRSEERFSVQLQDDLQWLGISWEEGPEVGGPQAPYFQSQRAKIYNHYYDLLEQQNAAYPCFCSDAQLAINRKLQLSRGLPPRYPGTCRKLSLEQINERIANGEQPTLRFHVPDNTIIEFTDLVKGPQSFKGNDIGDFIIRRADKSASFLFSNALDDSLMEITHVIRGEDHLTNTPRQLMILRALGLHAAQYAHLSMITGDDGAPLSKRHGSFGLNDFRQGGFLNNAVYNYLARLSHSYESLNLLTLPQLAENFHFEKLSRAPARFDKNQLAHWQKEAVMQLELGDVWRWLGEDIQEQVPADLRDAFANVMKTNILLPNEAKHWAAVFFTDTLEFSTEQLHFLNTAGEVFFKTAHALCEVHGADLKAIAQELKTTLSVSGKNLFMPIRICLTGEQQGPELPQIAQLLGAEKIQKRFLAAAHLMGKDTKHVAMENKG